VLTIAAKVLAALALAQVGAAAAETPSQVCHVLVTSDKVEDVSSMAAWTSAFITADMSDEQKGLAVWTTVVKFRHQEPPPLEFLQAEDNVHDAIKTFNVYGYGQCCCASSNIEALARSIGLKARGWGINNHSVPEVFWNGAWHLLDASLIDYFPKANGSLASVEEIIAGVTDWLDQHPEFKAKPDAAYPFGKDGRWRTLGPDVLAHTASYDVNGWLPAATHGWYSTMQEYNGLGGGNGKAFLYDYGYSQGYQLNLQFRPGERLVRNWSNKGLHINRDIAPGSLPGCMTEKAGAGQLRYAPGFGDLGNERIGNGTQEYVVPLGLQALRRTALRADNLAAGGTPGAPTITVADPLAPATLIIDLPSSYVYLGGRLSFTRVVPAPGDFRIAVSDNNGLDWKELSVSPGSGLQTLDLSALVLRRYDIQLRIILSGQGTGLSALAVGFDIQHSQRALPALGRGGNTIHVRTGAQEGTITIEAGATLANRSKQLVYTDFHPALVGIAADSLRVAGGQGSITFPVTTPGDMTRLRFGCNYRARDVRDGWDLQVSFDHGATFTTAARAAGPTGNGTSTYVTVDRIPAGTREALVRYAGQQVNTTLIAGFRIDADYAKNGAGFLPMQVTYAWTEGGIDHQDVHVTTMPDETYAIACAQKPTMRSIQMELAP
jgi:hypothetical protein